jgi:hypothetical protein
MAAIAAKREAMDQQLEAALMTSPKQINTDLSGGLNGLFDGILESNMQGALDSINAMNKAESNFFSAKFTSENPVQTTEKSLDSNVIDVDMVEVSKQRPSTTETS